MDFRPPSRDRRMRRSLAGDGNHYVRDTSDRRIYPGPEVRARRPPSAGRRSPPWLAADQEPPNSQFIVNIEQRARSPTDSNSSDGLDLVTIHLPYELAPFSHGRFIVNYEYQIKRRILTRALRNARTAIRNNVLELEQFFPNYVMEGNPPAHMREACRVIFDSIDRVQQGNYTTTLEEAIRDIGASRNRARKVHDWSVTTLALCTILHRRTGLGCSSFLLNPLSRLVETLLCDYGEYIHPDERAATFVLFLGAYSPLNDELRWRLQDIWDGLGHRVRDSVWDRVSRQRHDNNDAWEDYGMVMDLKFN